MPSGVEPVDITLPVRPRKAPGRPGGQPHWSSGAKDAVGTSISSNSRIWFTTGSGTLNEIYFRDADNANTRAVHFVVTGPDGYFSDEQAATHDTRFLEPGIPAVQIETASPDGRFHLSKTIFADPDRDTLLMRVSFHPSSADLRLFLVVDPQIQDKGNGNCAHIGAFKGRTFLLACREETALAVAASIPWRACTCGYADTSDGYAQLRDKGELVRCYNIAPDGNVRMIGELDLSSASSFTIAIGFGSNSAEAAQQTAGGLLRDPDDALACFVQQWREQQARYLDLPDLSGHASDLYRVSTSVLQTHQSKRFPGAFVASLSIPWGFARSDASTSGYHVLWPRDLCEIAMAKLASGDIRSAERALFYLACTQEADGHWAQNLWLDGTPDLSSIQLDATALPLTLAARLHLAGAPRSFDVWPMVERACAYLLAHGPCSDEERWEGIAGYSTFTFAVSVAALLDAAGIADRSNKPDAANLLRETADAWNDLIDDYCYCTRTPLAERYDVPGYYLRTAPPGAAGDKPLSRLQLKIPNLRAGYRHHRAVNVVSPDALQLVRSGLRSAHDPRMAATVRVIDGELRHALATGPGWRRSSFDGYGEQADGAPFHKHGIGRCWPLLAGERGHFELAAGRRDAALDLLRTMAAQTSPAGLMPEQVWDGPDIPERGLRNGHPTGSSMPLAWAHAEFIKLIRSLHENRVWDLPEDAAERYRDGSHASPFTLWTPNERRAWLRPGQQLRVMLPYAADIRGSIPGHEASTVATTPAPFGQHLATLPTETAQPGDTIRLRVRPAPAAGLKPFDLRLIVRDRAT